MQKEAAFNEIKEMFRAMGVIILDLKEYDTQNHSAFSTAEYGFELEKNIFLEYVDKKWVVFMWTPCGCGRKFNQPQGDISSITWNRTLLGAVRSAAQVIVSSRLNDWNGRQNEQTDVQEMNRDHEQEQRESDEYFLNAACQE